MQYLRDLKLDTLLVVSHGVKHTHWLITNLGLMDWRTGKIIKCVLNSGCRGYFINRQFKAESKLKKYPLTKVIWIQEQLPF